MAVLPIVRVPAPVLRIKTKKVRKIDSSIQKLIDDMIETMHDAPGVGLAAPQIGVSLRICVIHVPGEEIVTLVNPEIVKRSGERVCEGEGCLSLPGYKGAVPRAEKVVVKGLNRNGRPVRYHAEDLFAEAIEHELDHLDGKLYFDYIGSIDDLTPYTGREAEDEEEGAALGSE
ncbi:MAG TPA: peptide deformylase [Dehalococcoidia bacterium]|jgi:peptide deformylase|nr:peptide deformylase [Dehalococcoidia bacterium]